MTLKEIAALLGGEIHGPDDLKITQPAKIESAKEGAITFLSNLKYKHFLKETKASAVLLDQAYEGIELPYILVPNAYAAFVQVLKIFEPELHTSIRGISEFTFIDKSAKVHESVRAAQFVYIGPNVSVGKNTILYPGVVLLENATIGANCVLYPNVSVRENCVIGNRVILQNGCVVGSDGFGFAPYEGKYFKIPQMGIVKIDDDVEIGANTTIDRATLGETIIRQGTKLDNLIQIAHNVVVGKNTVMAAQSGIAGSTDVGDNVSIGGQAAIVGHIKVGDGSSIAGKSAIINNVPEKSIMWGMPAMPITKYKRMEISMRRLPQILQRIKVLEKELAILKNELEESRGIDGQETAND